MPRKPCPHHDIRIVQRSSRQSAVASAAYQSGERLFSEYDQKQKYYSHKSEIVHTEIMLPPHAPPEYADRNTLWNSAEAIEKQWNSQLARRFVLAIPRELPPEQYADLIRDYCREFFVSKGMIADFAIHDKGDGNLHAHILLTMPAMDEQGKYGFPRAGRSTTLTRTASVSGFRPADGKATRRTPWNGTTRSTGKSGGKAGLTQRTAIWKPSAAIRYFKVHLEGTKYNTKKLNEEREQFAGKVADYKEALTAVQEEQAEKRQPPRRQQKQDMEL